MQEAGLRARLDPVPLPSGKESFNVIGELPGRGNGPSLLFTGHMDHAPALGRSYDDLSRWTRDPFQATVEGDWIYGKGARDQKGGLCAMLIAAKALLEDGIEPRGSIFFVPVQGHKRVSSGTFQFVSSGFRTDYAIDTESTGGVIVPRWVGRAEGRFHVRARAGGRELHFHYKEIDPTIRDRFTVFEHAARILAALGPEMASPERTGWMSCEPHNGFPRFPQYRIEKIETVTQMHVIISFQVRSIPGQSVETIGADLKRVLDLLQSRDPYFEAELEFPTVPTREPVDTPDDDQLVQIVAATHRDATGRPAEIGGHSWLGASSDASILSAVGIKTLIYGPGGGLSDVEYQKAGHEGIVPPDERISIRSVMEAAKVYALIASRLCG